jgi:hypothetical protein
MLVSRLLRSLLRFLSPGIVPEGGGAPEPDPAPVAEVTPPADTPAPEAAAPAAAPAEPAKKDEPADPFAGLNKVLEDMSADGAKEKPPEPTPTPTPAPKAAAQKPGEPPAAKTDDFDYTPPEGSTPRAKERWFQLAGRAKQVPELERKFTETSTQLEAVRGLVNDSGLSAQEFADFMETARLFKQGDEKALQTLDNLRAELATRLGKEVPGVDLLAAHADLKADVESMTLTKERALEIARGRDAEKRLQGRDAEQTELGQIRTAVDTGKNDMATALQQRAGTPGHEAKMAYIGQYFADEAKRTQFVKTYEPKQWAAAALMLYDAYNPPAPAVLPGPQPLRPTGHRAGAPVQTGPVTPEGAVMRAFDRIGM